MFHSKKKIKTETVLGKDRITDSLENVFKTVLKILKELKEDMVKVKKMVHKQNRNINKG